MDSCAWASDLGKATCMHSPGAGSLLSLVCVVEQGGHRRDDWRLLSTIAESCDFMQ
ncbi:unnamed protein product, partial [Rangifer tarandus platyrhynchus]